ncbi:hypothetical protein CRP114_gp37 [Roseobacter phage CRP-114]|uniref:Internal virion protein A n=1 Tax=Roseobacter phage CRP-114 TaxID=3072842 RepID=A0AAX3ZX59_9CAUD|nr:hypothetical protein CRP114_gp37 [Roseobacter phage CRP-114]
MDKFLTPTTVEDIDYVAPRLRQADYRECLASTGRRPRQVLLQSLDLGGTTLTLRAPNGGRLGLCGVVPSPLENAGIVCMCATDDIYQYQTAFLRKSKAALDYLAGDYAVLYNCVDARNTVHMKWLRWMGFTFINKHEKYGAEKLPFYEFVRIN